jgi:hypothetical protein
MPNRENKCFCEIDFLCFILDFKFTKFPQGCLGAALSLNKLTNAVEKVMELKKTENQDQSC